MERKKRNITILLIGDRQDYDTYKKINSEKRSFTREGFEYVTINYSQLLKEKLPELNNEKIIVIFCFPFSHWNKYIEHKHYKGVYGNKVFYKKFMFFWKRVDKKIKEYLIGKKTIFINHPYSCAAYRDKIKVANHLAKKDIPQAKLLRVIKINRIQNRLSKGHQFFLKPRYGSMGKGITFLSQGNWQTNFFLRGNKILSRKSDKGWKFREVTNNQSFLKRILAKDIMIQEAVDSLVLDGNKIDFRMYTFFNKVIFIYPRKNKLNKVTTNITQGGRGDIKILEDLPRSLINKSRSVAEKTAKSLGINFAGIDIIPRSDLNKVYVIDVNLFSGLPKKRTFNLPRCLAEELSKLDDKGKLSFK